MSCFFSIGIVFYNETKYAIKCIESLLNQSSQDFELLLLDHSNNFCVKKYIDKNIKNKSVRITKRKNSFHSGGHNYLKSQMKGSYYICAINDLIYEKDFTKKLKININANKNINVFSSKIYYWDYTTNKKTTIIESCGIKKTFYGKYYDYMQGVIDKKYIKNNDYINYTKDIFGISGALIILSKSIIKKLSFKNKNKINIFDENLHYKNDIDLAHRINLLNEKFLIFNNIKIYHSRNFSSKKDRKDISDFAKISSFVGSVYVYNKYNHSFNLLNRFSNYTYIQMQKIYLLLFEHVIYNKSIKIISIRKVV